MILVGMVLIGIVGFLLARDVALHRAPALPWRREMV